MNSVRVGALYAQLAAIIAQLAVEFGACAPSNDVPDGTFPRKRRSRRPPTIVRPDDEVTPEHIKALAGRSLRERGFR